MQECDEFDLIRDIVASELDWNLRDAEVMDYRMTEGRRLQVILKDRCPRGAGDTREYLEGLLERANKRCIDVIVVHERA